MANRDDIFGALKEGLLERGIEEGKITYEADLVRDLGLDSLDTVEVTMGLEERFGVEIPDTELEDVATVSDAVGLVEKKMAVGA
ncbi:acyl carrier protein [soil metagenome]|jgi:acyl carrier protein|nr:acyl carrier protein [Actinomycetota bacterium]MDQ3531104.1 acyl carrier protein [Actinomycetota bacterium]MDQ3767450.1 acyl carrier protein [Actinomycetota bacterium]